MLLEVQTKWRIYEIQLGLLNMLRIPRKVIAHSPLCTIEMDFVMRAWMRTEPRYIRTTNAEGHRKVWLCAKLRVALAKTVTLPRLELCAAHLLVQLTHRISRSLSIHINSIHHWSDFMIVLGWIRADAKRWSFRIILRRANPRTN